jgi:RNA recognition motif-containing protein
MNIHIGNLPLEIRDNDLQVFFQAFGKVESVEVITNRRTGEPLGYAFVVMPSEEEGTSAIETLNGKEWLGKTLVVTRANRQQPRFKRKAPPRFR